MMKRLTLCIIFTLTIGCSAQKTTFKKTPPEVPPQLEAALKTAQEYKLPEYLPDLWEGIKKAVDYANKVCPTDKNKCQKITQKIKDAVLKGVEITYLVKEQR